jgi:ribokinase
MNSPLVCVVGSVNDDTTYRVPAVPGPGETVLSTGRTSSPGGKGGNQAAAASAVGATVVLVGAVGEDEAGRLAADQLAARGVDVRHLERRADASTGSAVILVGDDGENLIVVDPGANGRLDPERVARAVGEVAPAVTVGQLEVPVAALLAAARAGAGRFLLNPAPMPADPGILADLLAVTDLLVPNRSELGRLARRAVPRTAEEVRECVRALATGPAPYAGDTVVTLGSDGALVHVGGEFVEVPAESVRAVDTSGAGDVFCGVLAHRLAARDDLLTAVESANRAAAASTTVAGAQVPPDFATTAG